MKEALLAYIIIAAAYLLTKHSGHTVTTAKDFRMTQPDEHGRPETIHVCPGCGEPITHDKPATGFGEVWHDQCLQDAKDGMEHFLDALDKEGEWL